MERQEKETGRRQYYTGLPVTTAAVILPAIYIFGKEKAAVYGQIYEIILLCMSAAFLSSIKIKKPVLPKRIEIWTAGVIGMILLMLGLSLEI